MDKFSIPKNLANKWGVTVLQDDGWTSVPNLLLSNQAALSLTNTEMVMLINLISYAQKNTTAYPSISTLADRMQQHPRTIQRTINSLVKKKLLTKDVRSKSPLDKGASNIYDVTPLKWALEALSRKKLTS